MLQAPAGQFEPGHTDKRRWEDVAKGSHLPAAARAWEARSIFISQFIRPGENVMDLGAGEQKLRKYLPPGCGYVPVDCVDIHPGTYVVDFNREFRLPPGQVDVIVAAGFIQHLLEPDIFMRRLASACGGKLFIFTYCYLPETRAGLPTRFASPQQCSAAFSPHVAWLREAARFHDQSIFTGMLSSEVQQLHNPISTAVIDAALLSLPEPGVLVGWLKAAKRAWRRGLG